MATGCYLLHAAANLHKHAVERQHRSPVAVSL